MTDIDSLRAELARQTAIAVDHCERADAAERARDEVGIQLAAAQAEIARMRRAMVDVRALRAVGVMPDRVARALDEVFARLDAVPGDALAPVARGAPFDEAGTVNPDKITAALEASGIDSNNVKGVK